MSEPHQILRKPSREVLAAARRLAARGERLTIARMASESGRRGSGHVQLACQELVDLGFLRQPRPQSSYELVAEDARRAKIDRICTLVAANPEQLRAVLEAEL